MATSSQSRIVLVVVGSRSRHTRSRDHLIHPMTRVRAQPGEDRRLSRALRGCGQSRPATAEQASPGVLRTDVSGLRCTRSPRERTQQEYGHGSAPRWSVQRFAVQRCGRRQASVAILHNVPAATTSAATACSTAATSGRPSATSGQIERIGDNHLPTAVGLGEMPSASRFRYAHLR